MYKYNSLLIYIIKLGRNLGQKNEKKNQVTNLIENSLWALDVGRRRVDSVVLIFFFLLCVKWIQNLRHVILIVTSGQL